MNMVRVQVYLIVVDMLGEFHLRHSQYFQQVMFDTDVLCQLVLSISSESFTKLFQQCLL